MTQHIPRAKMPLRSLSGFVSSDFASHELKFKYDTGKPTVIHVHICKTLIRQLKTYVRPSWRYPVADEFRRAAVSLFSRHLVGIVLFSRHSFQIM